MGYPKFLFVGLFYVLFVALVMVGMAAFVEYLILLMSKS